MAHPMVHTGRIPSMVHPGVYTGRHIHNFIHPEVYPGTVHLRDTRVGITVQYTPEGYLGGNNSL